ncbi:unnamed protein product [Ranitomeya imitator]|uniref:Transmembrane protein n=1 Tax=Ranitomeya imitator TaxID=111125 RepID=A0ABN9LWP9_9NEOB|nr:unnamed protein product [Ranitomeya imitator]
MAIIADDSPSKEKESPEDITMTANEPPANEGFCTDEIINISQQPCTIEDPDKEPLPPLEITSEPEASGQLPVETKVKKKRQRKRKSKKIKAVVLVKGPRPKPGILSGKFHLTLPKKAVRKTAFSSLPSAPFFDTSWLSLVKICTITVPVTDFPIVIREDVHSDSLNEATFCPESVEVLKNYFACFKNLTLLKISYRKNRNEDLEPFWVEHGKGRGTSDLVDMNSAVCHKVAPDVSHIQSHRSDGGTSTENTAGSKGRSFQYIGILVIPIVFFAAIFVFAVSNTSFVAEMGPTGLELRTFIVPGSRTIEEQWWHIGSIIALMKMENHIYFLHGGQMESKRVVGQSSNV